MTAKKKIGGIISLLLIVGLAIGYYMYSKGPVDVKKANGLKIKAVRLYSDFDTDTTIAQTKYAGKILEVNGTVNKVSYNQQGEMIVLLNTNTVAAFVNCTFQQKKEEINPNELIQVKGICTGIGQGEPDLGIKADVYLTQCLIVE